jgi:hypothetical protein
MNLRAANYFKYSAGILLLITSFAKIASTTGNARILQTLDPLLMSPFRTIFWVAGGLELLIALTCFVNVKLFVPMGLIAWISSVFVAYRICLRLVNYNMPCKCMGNLTDAIRISPETAQIVTSTILLYLLIGSYASLFWLWRERRLATFKLPR